MHQNCSRGKSDLILERIARIEDNLVQLNNNIVRQSLLLGCFSYADTMAAAATKSIHLSSLSIPRTNLRSVATERQHPLPK